MFIKKSWIAVFATLLTAFTANITFAETPRSNIVQRFQQAIRNFRNLPVDRNHRAHGDRAFLQAQQFARTHNIPHFVKTMRNGQQRLVMNVHGQQNITAYCQAFSDTNCFMENFFTASATSDPSWSYCRIGMKSYRAFGTGSEYRTDAFSTRTAFPYSVTQEELSSSKQAIETTPNPGFEYNGGVLSGRFASNCTDWLTSIVGKLTGTTTASVHHHGGSLFDSTGSGRLTVQTIITDTPITNFGPQHAERQW